jgi:hypothetical protein
MQVIVTAFATGLAEALGVGIAEAVGVGAGAGASCSSFTLIVGDE